MNMKTIWKYTLQPEIEIAIPVEAKILAVQEQHGEAQLWVLVNPQQPTQLRKFKSYGTGHKIPDEPGEYIGTFQLKNMCLVFHVFELSNGRKRR